MRSWTTSPPLPARIGGALIGLAASLLLPTVPRRTVIDPRLLFGGSLGGIVFLIGMTIGRLVAQSASARLRLSRESANHLQHDAGDAPALAKKAA